MGKIKLPIEPYKAYNILEVDLVSNNIPFHPNSSSWKDKSRKNKQDSKKSPQRIYNNAKQHQTSLLKFVTQILGVQIIQNNQLK